MDQRLCVSKSSQSLHSTNISWYEFVHSSKGSISDHNDELYSISWFSKQHATMAAKIDLQKLCYLSCLIFDASLYLNISQWLKSFGFNYEALIIWI